jgi:signal recognition particle subunit SEC65
MISLTLSHLNRRWTCIYPIYLDAKRPYASGQRRVARAKGLWWPLSKDIADAASRLGLGTLHEINKSHPRDWENPGRVRVQWKKDGKLVNPVIGTSQFFFLFPGGWADGFKFLVYFSYPGSSWNFYQKIIQLILNSQKNNCSR